MRDRWEGIELDFKKIRELDPKCDYFIIDKGKFYSGVNLIAEKEEFGEDLIRELVQSIDGVAGPKGDKGDQGPQGPQGPQGDKGDKGDKGDQGPQGDKGDKGDQGPQGPQGPQGDQGDQGPQGSKGDSGIAEITNDYNLASDVNALSGLLTKTHLDQIYQLIGHSTTNNKSIHQVISNLEDKVASLENPLTGNFESDTTYINVIVTDNQTVNSSNFNQVTGVISVEWGDGSEVENAPSSGSMSHVYTTGGEYEVKIKHTVAAQLRLPSQTSVLVKVGVCRQFDASVSDITTIKYGAFSECRDIQIVSFQNCAKLVDIPRSLFDNCPEIYSFSGLFRGCSKLTSIPSGLFKNNKKVVNISSMFEECRLLSSIPVGLFDSFTEVTNASSLFNYCKALTTLPFGILDSFKKCTNFSKILYSCSALEEIPTGLFDNCIAATNFSYAFYSCSNISKIPEQLLSNCTSVTDVSHMFKFSSFSSIPQGLFKGLTNITSANNCFAFSKITYIPKTLFEDCPLITDLRQAFEGCSMLVEIEDGVLDTLNKLTNVSSMFKNCSALDKAYNLTSPELPKLWERDGTGGVTQITSFSSFASSSHATFRSTVPTTWGGTLV